MEVDQNEWLTSGLRNKPRYPLSSSLDGSQIRSGRYGKEKICILSTNIRTPDHPASSLVATPALLSRLPLTNTTAVWGRQNLLGSESVIGCQHTSCLTVCAYFVPSSEVAVICYCRPSTVLFMTSALRTFVTGEIAHILSYSSSYLEGCRKSELCCASTEHICERSWAAGRHRDAKIS